VEKFTFGRAPAGSSSLLTYEPYYGLREKPFSLSVDPKFLYKSPSLGRIVSPSNPIPQEMTAPPVVAPVDADSLTEEPLSPVAE
jgi:hypothetical protein